MSKYVDCFENITHPYLCHCFFSKHQIICTSQILLNFNFDETETDFTVNLLNGCCIGYNNVCCLSICVQEMKQVVQANEQASNEMLQQHSAEKRQLPKVLKNESKTRTQQYRASLQIHSAALPTDELRERLRKVRHRFVLCAILPSHISEIRLDHEL